MLAAVGALGHATPDAVAESIDADGGPPLSLSTVYRNLEALERVGAVSHPPGAPRAVVPPRDARQSSAPGVPGVRRGERTPVRVADSFASTLMRETAFVVDVRHMAVHGWCGACGEEA